MMLPSRQEAAQEELLRLREPKPVQFAKIYEELPNRKYRFPDLHQSVAKMIRQVFRVGIATVDLGPPATQKGQSDEFKGRVQKALVKMRENYSILDPLLTDRRYHRDLCAARRVKRLTSTISRCA